jgi:signal transduction histidine kinase
MMLATTSHEFRNPVSGILSMLAVMKDGLKSDYT